MICDVERIERICHALREGGLDAVFCTLPMNVLLLTGYWPVVGASVAIATREGAIALVVPADEKRLADDGWAHELKEFSPVSLDKIQSPLQSVRGALLEAFAQLKLGTRPAIGWESEVAHVPAPYVSTQIYGHAAAELVAMARPGAELKPAGDMLERLRAVLTPNELERLRAAARIAEEAFCEGSRIIGPGMTEARVANVFRAFLSSDDLAGKGVGRADGCAWCMSGSNSAEAYAAFQRSRQRTLTHGDLALVHCNSYADGFWTDITRTFCVGEPDRLEQRMYKAVFAASRAALQAVGPGVKASAVDRAARDIMAAHGFAGDFKHPTGHGVGFAAIDHNARPRIHPASDDVLEQGMVFNLEPGVYLTGFGGVRQCDLVAVTANGAELLTSFLRDDLRLLVLADAP